MEDLTGEQLGPYQIVAPVGEGGMAAVFRAYQPAMERYVALKVLPRHFANDPQFNARFQREAKLLAQLQHPYILPVFDFGQHGGYAYIVMPYVQSGTLADSLQGEPLPPERIRQVISQVGDALDHAHGRGMIHRDVKPSNVLIDEGGNCLLTDFGLARMVEGSVNLTASGTVMGTPAYMSPEQGSGGRTDARSDVYSLGVILYEMATGRVPYRAETPMAVIFKHIHDPLPPARELNPDLSGALERVILKALAKEPADRYQTAAELVRGIQRAVPEPPGAEAGTPASGAVTARADRSVQPATFLPRSRRMVPARVWLPVGITITAVAAITAGLLLRRVVLPATSADTPPGAPTASTQAALEIPPAVGTTPRTLAASPPGATDAVLFPTLPPISPSFPTLSQSNAALETATPDQASGTVVFDEDFEGGFSEHFTSISDGWTILADENGNAVLDIESFYGSESASVSFGSTAWKDYILEFRIRFLDRTDRSAGLEFRRNADGSRLYALRMDAYALTLLYTFSGGSRVSIATGSPGLQLRRWYNIKVEALGDQIRVDVDRLRIIDTTDSKITQGAILLSVGPPTHAQFDNLLVTSLGD